MPKTSKPKTQKINVFDLTMNKIDKNNREKNQKLKEEAEKQKKQLEEKQKELNILFNILKNIMNQFVGEYRIYLDEKISYLPLESSTLSLKIETVHVKDSCESTTLIKCQVKEKDWKHERYPGDEDTYDENDTFRRLGIECVYFLEEHEKKKNYTNNNQVEIWWKPWRDRPFEQFFSDIMADRMQVMIFDKPWRLT